ncbi:MAG: hypothetical protein H7240_12040 [Glaciimonas sp.]|nr:hypothetical protein [Glaciimonas sp.]
MQSTTLSPLKSIVAISMPTEDGKPSANFTATKPVENVTGAAAWNVMTSQFPFSFMPEKFKEVEDATSQPAVAPIVAPA